MRTGITKDWLDEKLKEGKIRGYTDFKEQKDKKKKSKYGNNKKEANGILFDSEKEARHYKKLLILLKSGHIAFLQLQVPFELNEGGTHSLKYIADFVYMDAKTGKQVVCDVKGMRTVIYKKKRKLMRKVHGIEILEV